MKCQWFIFCYVVLRKSWAPPALCSSQSSKVYCLLVPKSIVYWSNRLFSPCLAIFLAAQHPCKRSATRAYQSFMKSHLSEAKVTLSTLLCWDFILSMNSLLITLGFFSQNVYLHILPGPFFTWDLECEISQIWAHYRSRDSKLHLISFSCSMHLFEKSEKTHS